MMPSSISVIPVLSVAILLSAGLVGAGCKGDGGSAGKTGGYASPEERVKAELVEQIRTLREYQRLRQYRNIEPAVASAGRWELTRLLLAADRLLSANRRAVEIIEKTHTPSFAARWDLGFVANGLGIFSADYKTVDVTASQHEGIVHYQIAQVLPLQEARFVRDGNRWVYQPDVLTGLAAHVDRLAGAVDRLADEFARRPPTRQQVAAEFRKHILPIVREMETLSLPAPNGPQADRSVAAAGSQP